MDGPLLIGAQQALDATPLSATGVELEDRVLTWSSDNEVVASVSASGVVTARSEGTVGIVASSEGKTARIEIRIVAPNPTPVITALSPATIPAGTIGPIDLDVTGTDFTDDTRLHVDGVEQATQRMSPTTLRVQLGTAMLANAATLNVTATTPAPGGGVSNALALAIAAAPAPTITALEPRQITAGWAGTFTLAITGTGFTSRSVVTWDGGERSARFVNATTLHLTIDPQDVRVARVVPIVVATPAPGGGQASTTFPVHAIPVARVTVQSPWGFAWTWRNHGLPLVAIAEDQRGNELADRVAVWSVANPLIATTGVRGHREAAVYGAAAGETDVEAMVEGVRAQRTVRVHDTPSFDMVYEAGDGDDRHLMLWELSAGGARRRLPTTVAAFSPAPSPDGQEVAFAGVDKGAGPAGNVELYIVTRDGRMRKVSPSDAFDADPAWSPDGRKLAFASTRWSGALDVFVMDLATRNVTRLTDAGPASPPGSGFGSRAPAWSPDGTQIAYSSQTPNGSQLWVMSANGTSKRQLTNGTDVNDLEPMWSPDGSVIAFAREFRTPPQSRVMTVQPDGSNVTGIDGRVVSVAATPAYSPDGRWLTTSQTRGGGSGAVYAFSIAANAGPRVVVPVELGGGRHARWMRRP